MSLATRLLSSNPGAQVNTALSGALATQGAKSAFDAGGDYDLIESYTLASTSTAITFSAIPATYKHLEVRGFIQGTQGTARGNSWEVIRFNGTGTWDYGVSVGSEGNGNVGSSKSTVQSSFTIGDAAYQGGVSASFQTFIIKINNYSNTNMTKNMFMWSGWCDRGNTQNRIIFATGNIRSNQDVISSITFPNSNTSGWAVGTSIQLYGVRG